MTELICFAGGEIGPWVVTDLHNLRGAPLEKVGRLSQQAPHGGSDNTSPSWLLRGVVSHQRYTKRVDDTALRAAQPPLGRPQAVRAVLIPIRKSDRWWAMPQDERSEILENRSRHTAIGMEYLPAISRRLLHSRDLGEPFDFLTWFEFAPEDEPRFDELLCRLRGREEWEFVERECEIRLRRAV